MKAVIVRDFGGPEVLELAEVDRPEPGAGDVLVRIHAAGICYHDVLSRGGKIPGGRPGRILGHEIAGEIVAAGADVPAARVGERVVLYQRLFCGACRHCLAGRQDLCRNSRVLGEHGGGGYAEYACVPARRWAASRPGRWCSSRAPAAGSGCTRSRWRSACRRG
jgi:acryloyl-coenzyme A reductase